MNEILKEEKLEINVFKYTIHYARIYNYNDNSYKWRPIIPIKKVYNAWVIIPLFTEKEKFPKMNNYILIPELSKEQNIFIDLSRQDKILHTKENFVKFPIRDKHDKWIKLKKSTIKLIQKEQNIYLYNNLSILKNININE